GIWEIPLPFLTKPHYSSHFLRRFHPWRFAAYQKY
ncbi:MAG: hypothetical protein ACJAXU_002243, partial [Paracoccaceae bacterium]